MRIRRWIERRKKYIQGVKEKMTVKELIDILNDKKNVPNPEVSELCFYLDKENGETVNLELKRIGAFSISTDITFEFEEMRICWRS